MSALTISKKIIKHVPYDVINTLSTLPEEAQIDFFSEMAYQRKSLLSSYLFHFILFGSGFGYLNRWKLQIIYWLTLHGFVIGSVISLFVLPRMVRKKNEQTARKILSQVLLKYKKVGTYGSKQRSKSTYNNTPPVYNVVKPRKIQETYDPASPKLENLLKGGMFDYQARTWKVVEDAQYDWDNAETHRDFMVVSDLDKRHVYVLKEKHDNTVMFFEKINVFRLGEDLEDRIMTTHRPPNVISFQGSKFYREAEYKGHSFDIPYDGVSRKIKKWLFFDDSRTKAVSIQHVGGKEIKAFAGDIVMREMFTDILPAVEH